MKKILIGILALLIASPVYGAQVVLFNEGTGDVIRFMPKVNGQIYKDRTDALTYFEAKPPNSNYGASLAHMAGIPQSDWIVDTGVVREMTQGEKDARDAANAAAELAGAKTGAKSIFTQREWIAFIEILINEFNILRQWNTEIKSVIDGANNLADVKAGVGGMSNLSDRTMNQLKNAIDAAVDDDTI